MGVLIQKIIKLVIISAKKIKISKKIKFPELNVKIKYKF